MDTSISYDAVNKDCVTRTPSRKSIVGAVFVASHYERSAAECRSLDVHEDEFDSARVVTDSRQTTRVALRRKPKSMTISAVLPTNPSTVHMRRPSGILKALSYPTFHPHTECDEARPVSAHSAITPSTPPLPPTSAPPNRSPPQKRRPPASHSSYGVETTLGPPPSYTTQQRTLSQDRLRPEQPKSKATAVAEKATPAVERDGPQSNEAATINSARQQHSNLPTNNSLTTTARHQHSELPTNDTLTTTAQEQHSDLPTNDSTTITAKQPRHNLSTNNSLTSLPTPQSSDPNVSSPETLDSRSLDIPREGSDTTPPSSVGKTKMTEAAKRVPQRLGLHGAHDDGKASSRDESHKNEDLFLSIAKTDALRASAARAEKRRLRISSLPFFSGARPQTAAPRPSPMSPPFDTHLAPSSERLLRKRSSLGQHVPGALTSSSPAYFDNARTHLGKPSDQQSAVGSIGGRSFLRSRCHSNANENTPRPPTRSGRSRIVSESRYVDRSRGADQVATESTISTTAPSTVWSELDDLRSRIKRLELTGKLPPSSAAAMTTSERPRTATTAATTLSISPRNNKVPDATSSPPIESVPSTIHPLLHQALNKAKSGVSQDVYQKLHATAQDALQVSSMLSQEGYGINGAALSPQTERQIRRRTESMCRSLTELAIAMLSDTRNADSPTHRPATRGQHTGTATALRNRSTSIDSPDGPPVATRVQSRLESRRIRTSSINSPGDRPPVATRVQSRLKSRLTRGSPADEVDLSSYDGTSSPITTPTVQRHS